MELTLNSTVCLHDSISKEQKNYIVKDTITGENMKCRHFGLMHWQ